MIKKIEYRIFNMSEAEKYNEQMKMKSSQKKTWLDCLNEHGTQGWQVADRISKSSYLLAREIPEVRIEQQLTRAGRVVVDSAVVNVGKDD